MPQKNGTIILSKPIQAISKKIKPIAVKSIETRSDTPRPFTTATLSTTNSIPPVSMAIPKVKKSLAKITSTGASLRQTNLTKVPSKSMPKLNVENN